MRAIALLDRNEVTPGPTGLPGGVDRRVGSIPTKKVAAGAAGVKKISEILEETKKR